MTTNNLNHIMIPSLNKDNENMADRKTFITDIITPRLYKNSVPN